MTPEEKDEWIEKRLCKLKKDITKVRIQIIENYKEFFKFKNSFKKHSKGEKNDKP